jgi:toxin FitB
MSRGILDTSVLIATDITPIPGELAISIASLAQLQFSVLIAPNDQTRGRRLNRLSTIQRRFDALPIDDAVTDSYTQLAARVVQTGRQPRGRVRLRLEPRSTLRPNSSSSSSLRSATSQPSRAPGKST